MTDKMNGANGGVDPMEALKRALFDLYYLAGRNVTYVADSGERRAYWPNRYLQAYKRAVADSDAEVLAYVVRMVRSDEPSRGFGYLKDANRLDLTVEALVADPSKPWHHLFDADVVQAARDRLAAHGYQVAPGKPQKPASLTNALMATDAGMAVDLTVEVTRDGDVLLHAGEHTERAEGTLGAVQVFTSLLSQAEAAATAGK
jgi:hypothetical protein